MDIKVPRLTKGKGMKGPEPYGCFNTGMATVILRSRATGKYLVGPEIEVDTVREKILFGNNANKRIFKHPQYPHRTVYVFKTRTPAVAKFVELCNRQLAENESDRQAHQQAKRDAQSSNPETRMKGINSLMDYA